MIVCEHKFFVHLSFYYVISLIDCFSMKIILLCQSFFLFYQFLLLFHYMSTNKTSETCKDLVYFLFYKYFFNLISISFSFNHGDS